MQRSILYAIEGVWSTDPNLTREQCEVRLFSRAIVECVQNPDGKLSEVLAGLGAEQLGTVRPGKIVLGVTMLPKDMQFKVIRGWRGEHIDPLNPEDIYTA